jgi:hypothetical protein
MLFIFLQKVGFGGWGAGAPVFFNHKGHEGFSQGSLYMTSMSGAAQLRIFIF